MTFCTVCGTACAECATRTDQETAADREVEMERLRTKRDIEVARINAGVARDTAETYAESDAEVAAIDAEAGVAAAEAVAEVLEDIVSPDPPPAPDPVVITDPPDQSGEPDTIEPRETGSPGPPADEKSNWSYWG